MKYCVSFITFENYIVEAEDENKAIDAAELEYCDYYDAVDVWEMED